MECRTQIPIAVYSLNRLSIQDEVCAVTAASLKDYNLSLTESDCDIWLVLCHKCANAMVYVHPSNKPGLTVGAKRHLHKRKLYTIIHIALRHRS